MRKPLKALVVVVQVNRDFLQNGGRKYDGGTSEGVPCSFLCSLHKFFLQFQLLCVYISAHISVHLVALITFHSILAFPEVFGISKIQKTKKAR